MAVPSVGAAVYVENAYKYYGSSKSPKVVLDRLNMTVPQGTIYGLLGASGCGKTTLLTCIVGRRRLNSGDIWVLGGRPGSRGSGVPGPRVGYMPQDIALFSDFSFRETMFYFGNIFGMPKEEVEERSIFLTHLLELPPSNKLISNLSGGQKRRVSLAAALLHDPELLILDEPTVGVDPVLRQRIWDHLVQITVRGNTTVIITTHYIEEARQADTIGLMRNGVLLAEDTPNELLSLYGCDSLEDVFLLLCKKQGRVTNEETPGDIEMGGAVASPGPLVLPAPDPVRANLESVTLQDHSVARQRQLQKRTKESIPTDLPRSGMKSRKQIHKRASPVGKMTALLRKNFSRYWKNFGVMLFILGFPILQIGSFFIAIGHDPQHLPLAIVNDEVPFREGSMPTPHGAGPAYETADRCKGLSVSGCNLTRLSCRFLDTMNPTFKKRYYASQSSAEAAVKAGQAWGSLFFNTNFSESLTERLENGKDASDVALENSDLNISLDMSDRQISLFLRKEILKTYQTFVKVLLKECDINDKIGEIPVHFNTPIFGTEDTSYTMFMAPGVILTIVFFLSTGITCTTMITEVHEGIWDRALVTGMTSGEILLSHVITQFAVLLLQTFECLLLSFLVFDMDNNGSLWLISLLTCLNGFCGMCYGFLISVICKNISAANYLSIGSFYPMILLCGIMWPVEAMPRVLRLISRQLPLTRASEALRSIIIKGWGLTEPTVYYGFLTTFLWTAIMLVTCFVVLRLKKN